MALNASRFAHALKIELERRFGSDVDLVTPDGSRSKRRSPDGLELDHVRIDETAPGVDLEVVFHREREPRVKYGYRLGDLASHLAIDETDLGPAFDEAANVASTATLIIGDIEEISDSPDLGLPDGDELTITWL
jgi:hypothetical protein